MKIKSVSWICLLLIDLLLAFSSCGQTDNKKYEASSAEKTQTSFDSTRIKAFVIEFPKLKKYEKNLLEFYRTRQYNYAWFQDGRLIEQAGNLTNRLRNLKDDGVFKQMFYVGKLDSLTQEEYKSTLPSVKLELLLTAEYFVFSSLVWEGMNPLVSKDNNWFLPRKKVAYNLYLDSLLQSATDHPSSKEPVYRQYELLKVNLQKYRLLETSASWVSIGIDHKGINSKDTALITSQVKNRLMLLEDYHGKLLDTLFDKELHQALLRFQQRHGLLLTGRVDRQTLIELNIPIKTRIKQILVNMERSRWLPVTSEGDYLAVNIPEYKLHVYHSDSLLWSCNAVVGKTLNPTTLFYGEISQVVFSPYWNLPEGIVAKEILPGIKRDAQYLSKHNMESIGQRNGLPIVRQRPGPSNSLGLVKFLFPNSYAIYLHDTPSKSLFNETDRAFSHGCIRIEQPEKLAAFLLKENSKWNNSSINAAMHAGKEQYVSNFKKVPVYIGYFTAFVDRDNKLNFRKDIYGLDSRLASLILSGDGSY